MILANPRGSVRTLNVDVSTIEQNVGVSTIVLDDAFGNFANCGPATIEEEHLVAGNDE